MAGLTQAQTDYLKSLEPTFANTVYGIGDALQTGTLSTAEKRGVIKDYQGTVSIAELTASATNQEVAMAGFPTTPVLILGAAIEVDIDFSGGGATSATASIGDTGALTELAAATNVFTGAGAGLKANAPAGAPRFEATYVPVCNVISDVNVDTLTAGYLVARIFYIDVALTSFA